MNHLLLHDKFIFKRERYKYMNRTEFTGLEHCSSNRPHLLYSGRYDLKDTSKITLVDLQLISAMGPPGGGRNAVTSRFLRHFNIFSINPFSDDTMVHIFSNIVSFYLKNNQFPPEYFTVGNQIVTATMEVSAVKIDSGNTRTRKLDKFILQLYKTPKSSLRLCFLFSIGLQESHGEPASNSSQVSLYLQPAGLFTCYPRLPAD